MENQRLKVSGLFDHYLINTLLPYTRISAQVEAKIVTLRAKAISKPGLQSVSRFIRNRDIHLGRKEAQLSFAHFKHQARWASTSQAVMGESLSIHFGGVTWHGQLQLFIDPFFLLNDREWESTGALRNRHTDIISQPH